MNLIKAIQTIDVSHLAHHKSLFRSIRCFKRGSLGDWFVLFDDLAILSFEKYIRTIVIRNFIEEYQQIGKDIRYYLINAKEAKEFDKMIKNKYVEYFI